MKQFLIYLIKRTPKLILLAIVISLFGTHLVKRIRLYNTESIALTRQLFEMESLLSSRQMWDSRSNWIKREIPGFDTREAASRYLLNSLLSSLPHYQLQFDSQQFHSRGIVTSVSDETISQFDTATIELTIKGNEHDIVKWIHDLQRPGKFRGINRITIESDGFGLLCAVQITQWYRGTSPSLNPGQHHETEVHHPGPDLVKSF